MAELRKRLVRSIKNWRLWVFGTVVLLGSLLGYLQTLGISTGYSGDMICGGSTICKGEFWIDVPPSVTNYLGETVNITQLCFGKDLRVVLTTPEKINNLGLYKADRRYKADNPARWKKFNFTGNCINIGNNSFMINATKDEYSTVRWAITEKEGEIIG